MYVISFLVIVREGGQSRAASRNSTARDSGTRLIDTWLPSDRVGIRRSNSAITAVVSGSDGLLRERSQKATPRTRTYRKKINQLASVRLLTCASKQ
jgi:hypothetical protein